MKTSTILIIITVIIAIIIGIWLLDKNKTNSQTQTKNITSSLPTQSPSIDAKNCISDECLEVNNLEYPVDSLPDNIQKALSTAINDEYKAEATYQKIVDTFGEIRPFIMIKRAESQHINSLKAIYEKYGISIPENNLASSVPTFTSIAEACQAGVDAEIANVAIYDNLFDTVKDYDDITNVFTVLRDASQNNHLPAFQKCAQ